MTPESRAKDVVTNAILIIEQAAASYLRAAEGAGESKGYISALNACIEVLPEVITNKALLAKVTHRLQQLDPDFAEAE